MTHLLKNIDILPTDSKSQIKNEVEDDNIYGTSEYDHHHDEKIDEDDTKDGIILDFEEEETKIAAVGLTDSCKFEILNEIQLNDSSVDVNILTAKPNIKIAKKIKVNYDDDRINFTDICDPEMIDEMNDGPVLNDNTNTNLLFNRKSKNVVKIAKQKEQTDMKPKKQSQIYKPSHFILSLSNIGDKNERRKNETNVVDDNSHVKRDADVIPESFSEESSPSSEDEFDDNGKVIKKTRVYPRTCDDTHTCEKSYKCQIWGAGFAHKGNVGIHIRSKHEQLDKKKRKNEKKRKLKRKYTSDDSLINLLELKKEKYEDDLVNK